MKKSFKYLSVIIIFLLIFYLYLLFRNKTSISDIYDSLVYIESIDNSEIISGSGFVYKVEDNRLYIVTNYHVIENSKKIFVYNVDEEKVTASLLGYDKTSDIAVITVENGLQLKSAKIGNSNKVNVGDSIYAVGNPISSDYVGTVTHGIVSYLNREIKIDDNIYRAIQIDAPIDAGNSGGPVLNKDGNVIGIVFVKESEVNFISFVLPINFVMKYVEEIEKNN